MVKEKKLVDEITSDLDNHGGELNDTFDSVYKALTELEELKRYPTSEEVCKALIELRNCDVYYNSHLKRFYHTYGG